MGFARRFVHTATVMATVFLSGLVMFFVVGSVGLRFSSNDTAVEWATIALPWVLLALSAWGIWKKASYALLLPVLALSGGLVVYLAYDDPAGLPPPDLGPVAPAKSKSYEVYRWFLKEGPHSRVPSFRDVPELPRFPDDHAKWPGFFAEHRQEFTQAWANDALGREWIEAMAGTAPEGIYPPPESLDQPLLSFASYRYTASVHLGYAEVLVLDQKQDEAAGLLLSFLRANYHLQRGGISLLTEQIALIGVHGAYDQLEQLIKSGELSSQSRIAIAATLNEAPPIRLLFQHIFVGEEILARISIETVVKSMATGQGAKLLGTPFLQRLLFNPRRSEREYVEFLHAARRLAELRQPEEGKKLSQEFEARADRWIVKNPGGQMLIQMMLPAFNTKAFWKSEDQRLALLHQLENR